ncbi:hypothetical protein BDW02DRAFT_581246 [Decorospora gaudefroyi]|uniref:Uncharacterized protein n=1 Tax=Decorospora gaudefroyi TaxID=184978 RepID=A0A6A5K8Q1_9PLEO|nr:hypothetical protein BDW02DRAFT_581246 [Decorospora gaudefroyi]
MIYTSTNHTNAADYATQIYGLRARTEEADLLPYWAFNQQQQEHHPPSKTSQSHYANGNTVQAAHTEQRTRVRKTWWRTSSPDYEASSTDEAMRRLFTNLVIARPEPSSVGLGQQGQHVKPIDLRERGQHAKLLDVRNQGQHVNPIDIREQGHQVKPMDFRNQGHQLKLMEIRQQQQGHHVEHMDLRKQGNQFKPMDVREQSHYINRIDLTKQADDLKLIWKRKQELLQHPPHTRTQDNPLLSPTPRAPLHQELRCSRSAVLNKTANPYFNPSPNQNFRFQLPPRPANPKAKWPPGVYAYVDGPPPGLDTRPGQYPAHVHYKAAMETPVIPCVGCNLMWGPESGMHLRGCPGPQRSKCWIGIGY